MEVAGAEFLTVPEVAKLLRVTTFTIRSWILQRRIPFIKPAGRILFNRAAVNQWLEERAVPARTKQ